jgi:hypothetical protein
MSFKKAVNNMGVLAFLREFDEMKELSLNLSAIDRDGTRVAVLPVHRSCAAVVVLNAFGRSEKLVAEALCIRWESEKEQFVVSFSGRVLDELDSSWTQSIPLLIAETSTCECGGTLTLGDYEIKARDKDFVFTAQYICSACAARKKGEQRGFRQFIGRWLFELRKIEVGPKGISAERDSSGGR